MFCERINIFESILGYFKVSKKNNYLSSLMEKEKRGANFIKAEIDLLIDIMLKYKHIIKNKRTDATT